MLMKKAVTVIKNHDKLVPIRDIEKEKIAYIKLGNDKSDTFLANLRNYASISEITNKNLDSVLVQLQDYTKVIIGYHKQDGAWRNHNLNFKEMLWINQIAKQNDVILTCFTKPYSLTNLKNFEDIETIVMAYQNNDIAPHTTFTLQPTVC